MSAFVTVRVFDTGDSVFCSPIRAPISDENAAPDTNVSELFASDAPNAPNCGRECTGCGVGIDAFGSPIIALAMVPPLRISDGLTPKNIGFQMTRSAHLPTSTDPTSCAMPCVSAGLIVYFAT